MIGGNNHLRRRSTYTYKGKNTKSTEKVHNHNINNLENDYNKIPKSQLGKKGKKKKGKKKRRKVLTVDLLHVATTQQGDLRWNLPSRRDLRIYIIATRGSLGALQCWMSSHPRPLLPQLMRCLAENHGEGRYVYPSFLSCSRNDYKSLNGGDLRRGEMAAIDCTEKTNRKRRRQNET